MTVFITPNHDSSMIQSQTKTMSSDDIALALFDGAMSDNLSDAEHEFHYSGDDTDAIGLDDLMMSVLEDLQY